jgi:hypothetical protein
MTTEQELKGYVRSIVAEVLCQYHKQVTDEVIYSDAIDQLSYLIGNMVSICVNTAKERYPELAEEKMLRLIFDQSIRNKIYQSYYQPGGEEDGLSDIARAISLIYSDEGSMHSNPEKASDEATEETNTVSADECNEISVDYLERANAVMLHNERIYNNVDKRSLYTLLKKHTSCTDSVADYLSSELMKYPDVHTNFIKCLLSDDMIDLFYSDHNVFVYAINSLECRDSYVVNIVVTKEWGGKRHKYVYSLSKTQFYCFSNDSDRSYKDFM